MRWLLISAFAANVILSLVAWVAGPDPVATHFGADGRPDGWMSAAVNALFMIGVDAVIFAAFYGVPWLVRAVPARFVSLPNRDYWLSAENRTRLDGVLTPQMYRFGAVTLAFMFAVSLLVLRANLGDPVRLPATPFWWIFGLFMLYTVYWCIMLILALRVPAPRHGRG